MADDSPPARSNVSNPGSIDLARLQRMTGFLLRLGQMRVYDAFHAALSAQNITPARYSLLAVLHDNPNSRSGQIADALRVKPSNMAVLLAQMEAEALIERLPDPSERRASLVRLTEAGRAMFQQVDPIVRQLEAGLVEALSPAERVALLDQLARVAGLAL
jgi:DNA-binding MarR family transcriptional regulator